MLYKRSRLPSYRLHKPSGQAVVSLNGVDHYRGKHGTAASREAYDRLIAAWLANGRQLPTGPHAAALTVSEVLVAYLRFAKGYYRKDGRPTSELTCTKAALRPLKQLYGRTPAGTSGPWPSRPFAST